MTRAAIGLGDLVQALANTPPEQWAWVAAALGRPDAARAEEATQQQRPSGAGLAQPVVMEPASAPAAPAVTTPHVDVLHAPDPPQMQQVFWRVASDMHDPDARQDVPAWVTDGPVPEAAEFDGDPDVVPAPSMPLARPAQAASFLRRHLAQRRIGTGLDMVRLVRLFSNQQPLRHVPRQHRLRWPARVQLVYDTQPQLGPLHEDLRALARQLGRLLGPRLTVSLTASQPGWWYDTEGQLTPIAADGRAVVVLGDAGLLRADGALQARWARAGRALTAGTVPPLLLAPVPRRLATRAVAQAFRTVLMGAGPTLRIVRPGRLPAQEVPVAADGAGLSPEAGAIGEALAPAAADGLAALRAAIYGDTWVTPAVLRALR
jgi:hypothetical protein